MHDLASRLAKRASGKFYFKDLNDTAQELVKPNSNVTQLPLGKWVNIGSWWLLNQKVSGDMDDAWVHIIVKKNVPFLNWLLLPFAKLTKKAAWIRWWEKIPNTNLILDVWYVGDGSEGIALVAESK